MNSDVSQREVDQLVSDINQIMVDEPTEGQLEQYAHLMQVAHSWGVNLVQVENTIEAIEA